MAKTWMIYGAYGYTGELIAREAVARGLTPILSGRNSERLRALAAELDLEARPLGLENAGQLARQLQDVDVLVHCAGPFSATSAPMIEACLASRTHYLDITGEISVFEHAHRQSARAATAGIVLCPGAGFDVIPTDCLAAKLHQALPDAQQLSLGFDSRSGLSPGTAKTSVEGLGLGGRIRKRGNIVQVPLAYRTQQIDFGAGEKTAMTIPWGDVATSYYSTGIPNIEVYIPTSPKQLKMIRRLNWVRPLLSWQWIQNLLKSRIQAKVKGPNKEKRDASPTYVWGTASNTAGQSVTGRVKTANGYDVTVEGALAMLTVLLDYQGNGGYYTPSALAGADLVTHLPGSGEFELESTTASA